MSKNVSTIESNRAVADEFNAAVFGNHDVEAGMEFLSRDFVHYESGEEIVRGIDGAREYFESMLATFPDVEMDVAETVAEDDRLVQFFEVSATHDGDMAMGEDLVLRPTGERLTWHGFVSMRIDDGKIAEVNLVTDDVALYRQLGVIPLVDEFAA